MYHLNNYGLQHRNDFENNVYRGFKMNYTNLLQYKRNKGKIILFTNFIFVNSEIKISKLSSGRKRSKEIFESKRLFSVIYYIKNIYRDNWIPNLINVTNESKYRKEKDFLFQPFSFFHVKDVQIDMENYTGDIYLETIGRTEILEEKIKNGKEIIYNKEENIMQIK